MDTEATDSSSQPRAQPSDAKPPANGFAHESPSELSSSRKSSGGKSHNLPQPTAPDGARTGGAVQSTFSRFTSGIGLSLPSRSFGTVDGAENASDPAQTGIFESFTKGLVDSSKSAVKAVQVKARHIVSQNKRRYQEGGFDLDMAYVTENIIAMGFPAGDLSSGLFGFFEGFYRNHMEEVIKFFETHHKGKFKVYNLCSERLYDASLFEGKVASFPFDDHNCPPLQLITSFCQSASSWVKEDIQNVVVVHCKAGMGRTGLMICSLLLFLKLFANTEEAVDYFNQKRCVDGKALVLPSQIRYVKYFERVLMTFDCQIQPGRRCMLRGFRLHKCPYWIRPAITISNHNGILFSTKLHPKTKDLMPEDFWISSSRKGIMVFAIPGEPGLTELAGDFKIHFHDRQGDFYCWLNTTMMDNRMCLKTTDLDDFDKRNLPSPGFEVEVVMMDYNATASATTSKAANSAIKTPKESLPVETREPVHEDNDDVFSDSDTEDSGNSITKKCIPGNGQPYPIIHRTEELPIRREEQLPANGFDKLSLNSEGASNIKAIAADASVFTFGDDEDYESE